MLPIVIVSLLGCPGPDDKDDDDDVAEVCDAQDVQCEDDLVSLLLNEDRANNGEVTTTQDGDDFVTLVDATSGGSSSQAATKGWVYVRFTEDGAEKVDITDGESLSSQEWHMALRRYNLRLNSGVSGPSCVYGTKIRGADYADVTEAPDAEDFAAEAFFDESCETVSDDHGLGDPAYVLNEWWTYGSCVEPTMDAFAVQTEDGSVLKLVVEAYYEDQSACPDSESGWISMRWAWL